ncbi:chromodomain Y-like protein 2 [Nephila pilipes]|uniref:Chromodomain Y-like protein 2 n=1 Tax=Nephila pilipes TaxID=299642 RepID=A0A8X6PV15_NEPPI|nr:chromodomain Y-like protein 2 [Nephila pilipes]
MDKSIQNVKNVHAANSLPLDPDILDSQPRWPRCNSFSSSSNDSSVFSNSPHQAEIHLTNDGQHSKHLSKRNRNSSGSSISSNMSCVSDKDTKKTSVTISSNSVPQVAQSEMGNDVESLARLACSNMSSNNFNLQHEALISNGLTCSDTLNSVLPFRHNLRRNIRKKKCSCDCTATCTTLVVRRYNETTLERETVISSTKVQTCMQNNAAQTIHNMSFENNFSPNKADNNRKRRSEVEKLYDSLHEIKWAKNFSPDNILRQINIRQAASCSLFGKSTTEKPNSIVSKPCKRQKIDYDQSSSASCTKHSLERKKSTKSDLKQMTTNFTLRSHIKNGITSREIMSSNYINSNKNSPLKELNISDVFESHEKNSISPLLAKNKHNYLKSCTDSSLKPEFPESSSVLNENCVQKRDEECSINLYSSTELATSLPINYLFNLKNEPNTRMNNSDTKPNYPSTYYGIAEEGIHTIDACFLEVGAEVVVSTCIEKDCDIPHLTSISDSNISDKHSTIHDNPPVLEPCISLHEHISFQNIQCKITPNLYGEKLFCIANPREFMYAENHVQVNSYVNKDQNQHESTKALPKLNSNINSRYLHNLLIKDARKKILSKYLRIMRAKAVIVPTEKSRKKEYPTASSISNNIMKKNSSLSTFSGSSDFNVRRKKNSSHSPIDRMSDKCMKRKENSSLSSLSKTSEQSSERKSSIFIPKSKITNGSIERKKLTPSPICKISDEIAIGKENTSLSSIGRRSRVAVTRKENLCTSPIDSVAGKESSFLSSVGKRSQTRKDNSLVLPVKRSRTKVTSKENSSLSSVSRTSDESVERKNSAQSQISSKNIRRKENSSISVIDKSSSVNVTRKANSSNSPISQTIDTSVIANKSPIKGNSSSLHISTVSPISVKAQESSLKTDEEKPESKTVRSSNQKISHSNLPQRMPVNQNPGGSIMYSNDNQSFNHEISGSRNMMNQSVIVQTSTNVLRVQHAPVPSATYMPISIKAKDNKTTSEIPRPRAVSFTCHYQTIKVNRENCYTQVQLKLSRGCSILLTVETLTEMKEILNRTNQDCHCRTLILNGIGDSFCLGLDLLPLLGPQKIKASNDMAVAVKEFIEALSEFKKPFVAVANGSAFGLGMTILNHADISIASDAATFCLPQTSLGYFPEGGATLTLPQAVGSTIATDLILRGRLLTAQEAKDIGLVSEIMEAKCLPYDLVSRVKMLAENSLPSMETAKAMLRMRLHLDLMMVLENEVKLLPKIWLSRSCQEAIQNTTHTWLLGE